MKKTINIILMSFMLLIFSFVAFFGNVNNTYAAVPEGEQAAVSEEYVTMYYLRLPTENITIRTYNSHLAAAIVPWLSPHWNVFEDAAMLTNNRTHTFIFTYNNINVGSSGAALLTTWNIECSTVGWGNFFTGHLTFYPKEDIEINIRSEYYELFQSGDFSDITITYMYNGNGYIMQYDSSIESQHYDLSGAELLTREVPPDYDPIEEEGQAPDNGGIAVSPVLPPAQSFLEKIENTIKTGVNSFFVVIVVIVAAVLIIRFAKPKK